MRTLPMIAVALAGLGVALYPGNASAHDEPVVGSLVGAGLGAVVAGPPGAAVGAVLGAAVGATVAHDSDHGRHARREARYVQYSRATPACEPERRAYRTTTVYREDGSRGVRTSLVEKPKYKKVCRYVRTEAAARLR